MAKISIHEWFSKRKKEKESDYKIERLDVPGNLWVKCYKCNAAIFSKDLKENYKICPKCGYHFKLSAKERIEMTLDENSFKEFDQYIRSKDFLDFTDSKPYAKRLTEAIAKSGLNDAVITGEGTIEKMPVKMGIMDFSFMGGSMGSVVGEKITRMIEHAVESKQPVIIFSTSGGARMQEGIMSLMQMAKTSEALGRLRLNGIPYISIITDPTTGGTSASYAMLGDINIAEPGALICFAGPRVIEQTIRQKLPPGFQRSEYLKDHGMVDIVCSRNELKATLVKLLKFFSN
ncbi:MAG: acetyl-CoA carboxylase, carboxyltransferase subunit beta [Candidatus Margulisiibacteriota bacterium]|nr:acetyl-CoA carboxylase, carboxyltransferase subunit beta [Candidatus Margulisiibacteriota bacterium]